MMNFPLLASTNTFRLNIRSQFNETLIEIKHFIFFKQNSVSQSKYRHDILISIRLIFHRKAFDFFFAPTLNQSKNHAKILKNLFFFAHSEHMT